MTAVEWFFKWFNDNQEATHKEFAKAFDQAKAIEKEQMINFACKVVEVSSEKYIQGKTTEQIAEELLTFKSE